MKKRICRIAVSLVCFTVLAVFLILVALYGSVYHSKFSAQRSNARAVANAIESLIDEDALTLPDGHNTLYGICEGHTVSFLDNGTLMPDTALKTDSDFGPVLYFAAEIDGQHPIAVWSCFKDILRGQALKPIQSGDEKNLLTVYGGNMIGYWTKHEAF